MHGAVADDFTGATDLAGNWRSRGLRTAVTLGVPANDSSIDVTEYDAIVVALKIRSVAAEQARKEARSAGRYLLNHGYSQIYDKYCSTFDSTPEGNIGPIADELTEVTGADRAVIVPSFPDTGRTVYRAYHFVGDQLLSESSMRHHPLNPMTDSNLVRLMEAQTDRSVSSVTLDTVRQGPEVLRNALDAADTHYIVIDAIDNNDLQIIAEATMDDVLITGGSGIALGLPNVESNLSQVRMVRGSRVVLSGSASSQTQRQVAVAKNHLASQKISTKEIAEDRAVAVERIAAWASEQWQSRPGEPVLVYSVDSPDDVSRAKDEHPNASQLLEEFFAELAHRLSELGARQFIIAGGETSGSVVKALGIELLELGQQLSPGVSWLLGKSEKEYNLVLKSGNFGLDDLFVHGWSALNE